MTVLIADALPVISAGIRTALARQPDVKVVGMVRDAPSAIALARRTRCSVAVVDSELPPLGGTDFLRRLTAAPDAATAPKVIVMDTDGRPGDGSVLAAGASAVVEKGDILSCLVPLLRLLAGNDLIVMSGRHRHALQWSPGGPGCGVPPATPEPLAALTEREREVFLLAARGLGCRELADLLGTRESTARSHLHHALRKLGLRDRAQLVAFAYESGLVEAAGPGDQSPR